MLAHTARLVERLEVWLATKWMILVYCGTTASKRPPSISASTEGLSVTREMKSPASSKHKRDRLCMPRPSGSALRVVTTCISGISVRKVISIWSASTTGRLSTNVLSAQAANITATTSAYIWDNFFIFLLFFIWIHRRGRRRGCSG